MEGFISLSVLRGRAAKTVKAPRGWENQGLSSCSLCLRTPPPTKKVSVNHALQTLDGRETDHKILQIETVLPRPHAFTWEVHKYLKTSKDGDAKLISLLNQLDCSSVQTLAPNVHDMALEFNRILDELMKQCYCWKRTRRKTLDKPWISDGLCSSIKKEGSNLQGKWALQKVEKAR